MTLQNTSAMDHGPQQNIEGGRKEYMIFISNYSILNNVLKLS